MPRPEGQVYRLDLTPRCRGAPIGQGFARNGLSFPWFVAGGDHANRVANRV